jgi:hypothetical protein
MERVYFTEHKGRRILVLDLSDLSAAATPPVLQELEKMVAGQPAEKNLLLLVNVRRNIFNPETVEEMKRVSKANEPRVLATAMVGMSKLGSIVARQVYRSAGRTYEAFDGEEQAKDWLAAQQPAKKV